MEPAVHLPTPSLEQTHSRSCRPLPCSNQVTQPLFNSHLREKPTGLSALSNVKTLPYPVSTSLVLWLRFCGHSHPLSGSSTVSPAFALSETSSTGEPTLCLAAPTHCPYPLPHPTPCRDTRICTRYTSQPSLHSWLSPLPLHKHTAMGGVLSFSPLRAQGGI